jgi:hypothetical protein
MSEAEGTSTDWEKLYNSAITGRHAFRQMAIRYRNALRQAVEWAGPMAEAPVDARPAWFDAARAALEGPAPSPGEVLSSNLDLAKEFIRLEFRGSDPEAERNILFFARWLDRHTVETSGEVLSADLPGETK